MTETQRLMVTLIPTAVTAALGFILTRPKPGVIEPVPPMWAVIAMCLIEVGAGLTSYGLTKNKTDGGSSRR